MTEAKKTTAKKKTTKKRAPISAKQAEAAVTRLEEEVAAAAVVAKAGNKKPNKPASKSRPVAPPGPVDDPDLKMGAATIKLVPPHLEKFLQVKANMERLVPGLNADKATVLQNALHLAAEYLDILLAEKTKRLKK